ncbi:MAG: FtsW/RodA/SpoVE family cell cycle protein [Acidobacteria bacterium]|nr:FtsW/RodA/SpoVE family cell cycle protein [Acidobacteriota bacterium]
MKNRASSHLIALLLIIGFEIVGYYAVHRAALIRGYETSWVSTTRDLMLYVPIIFLVFLLTRVTRFAGNWTLYTTAILLFSVGMLVQYRLYSDPEYNAKNKSQAREQKADTQRLRYINEHYDAEKKRLMGLPATPPKPTDLEEEAAIPAKYSIGDALTSGQTWIPLFSFFAFAVAYFFCLRDDFLLFIQRHGFVIVLITLAPLTLAVITSSAGKAIGNMTPWEPSKIPFLLGFAGILTARYKELARTYWGIPSARDVVPLLAMALMPFIPFFALKDFGQMLVFSGAYATLYLVAVRRWPQLFLFVGSVLLVVGILVVGALPQDVQEKVPLLPTLARPVSAALPSRIQQRFHLWLDGFDPPSPNVPWWKKDYDEALAKDPKMRELAEQSPAMQNVVNVDIWFDRVAFQPAQAIFGVSAGKNTGRGLGLGYAEVIPVADSDYIYAAIGEEMGLAGGAIVILALIVFVSAGVRTSLDARDMFTKLCAAGLTAFIGFQALVNIGGITRALPMTGITLPFVSHGGFSLITSFAMLGMLMAFSHRNAAEVRAAVARPEAIGVSDPTVPEAVQ